MKNYKLTLIGIAISAVVFLSTIISDADLFEQLISTLENFERFEVDEFIIPIVILGSFVLFYLIRRQGSQKIEFQNYRYLLPQALFPKQTRNFQIRLE